MLAVNLGHSTYPIQDETGSVTDYQWPPSAVSTFLRCLRFFMHRWGMVLSSSGQQIRRPLPRIPRKRVKGCLLGTTRSHRWWKNYVLLAEPNNAYVLQGFMEKLSKTRDVIGDKCARRISTKQVDVEMDPPIFIMKSVTNEKTEPEQARKRKTNWSSWIPKKQ